MTYITNTCSDQQSAMDVVVGTYEELILGYSLEEDGGKLHLRQKFTDHSHVGSVRALALSKNGILASGSADESIHLFNLKTNVEKGSLIKHNGSVTSVQFYGNSHLFSGSEDGTVCVWQTTNWECVKTLKGHKGAVYSLSVHPSGKLALSIGKDRTLRTWNLITGRSAFVVNIRDVADVVEWSPDGDRFCVLFDRRLDVYNVEKAEVCYSVTTPYKLNSATFATDDVIVIGGEEGRIEVHNIAEQKQIHQFNAECTRVKCAYIQPLSEDLFLFILASSDGLVKVYHMSVTKGDVEFKLKTSVNTKFRLLSLAVQPRQTKKTSKSKSQTTESTASVKKNTKDKRKNKSETHCQKAEGKAEPEKEVSLVSSSDSDKQAKKRTAVDSDKTLKKRKMTSSNKNGDSNGVDKQLHETKQKKKKKKKNANA